MRKHTPYIILAVTAVAIILLSLVGCSKPEFAPVPTLPQAEAAPEKAPVIPPPVAASTPEALHASFASTPLAAEFYAEWTVFTNHWHPNGYVIIESFGIPGEVYRLGQVSPSFYVENVHQGLKYAPSDALNTTPGKVRDWFRTAEALVAALYSTRPPQDKVAESAVFAAGQQMFGRAAGVAAASALK